jgi:hypothetical protein
MAICQREAKQCRNWQRINNTTKKQTMKTIEFETRKNTNTSGILSPWIVPGQSSYQDMILKPEYESRKAIFPIGKTWFRVVPGLRESRGWLVGVHSLDLGQSGRFAHARSIKAGAQSVFDTAYSWFRNNEPEQLFSKENKKGFRLLPKPMSLCWILMKNNDKLEAKIMVSSGYNGERGGVPGLGHSILDMVESVDENVDSPQKPIDPDEGVQFCLEKLKARGAQFPVYRLSMGRQPAPIQQFLDELDSAELSAIQPLEEVIRTMSEEEEWELLAKVVGNDYRNKIQADTSA